MEQVCVCVCVFGEKVLAVTLPLHGLQGIPTTYKYHVAMVWL